MKRTYRNRLPWLSEELKTSIKEKNKLHSKFKKYPTWRNEITYKKSRNILTHLLKQEEKTYYQNILNENKDNLRKTWSIIKGVINRSRKTKLNSKFLINDSISSDKAEISNSFNKYFVSVGSSLAKNIPQEATDFRYFLPQRNIKSIFLNPVNVDEIKKIVCSLKNTAPGWDDMSTKSIKFVFDSISQPLVYIMNLSFQQGIFPNELKIAKVFPLYKANDPMKFSNYRLISLLSVYSRLFEKIMYNRLLDFLNKYHILYKYQFGFRKEHSTYMALLLLLDNLTSALDRGEYAVGIFLDFQKAFDTVDHNILLKNKWNHMEYVVQLYLGLLVICQIESNLLFIMELHLAENILHVEYLRDLG